MLPYTLSIAYKTRAKNWLQTKRKDCGHYQRMREGSKLLERTYNHPVIIGSSLTGLLISHSLANQGIRHCLIGGERPGVLPRLGESMNEGASLACWRLLDPKYRRHFFPKSHISLMNGDFASMILVASPNRCFDKIGGFLGDKTRRANLTSLLAGLCHLDRANFDPEFYDDVVSHGCCEFIKDSTARVHFEPSSDSISRIEIGSEVIQRPQYVFDATGFHGVVAKAAGVGMRPLTQQEHVAWTHRIADRQPNPKLHWILNGTNLLRLDQVNDGLDAIAWIIPTGKRISLGISVAVGVDQVVKYEKQQLIDILIGALTRRGIDIAAMFPCQDQVFDITHRYFKRDRAYGANWLLAGGTFLQYWFPTSSGVGNCSLAATLASDLIKSPIKFGKFYQDKLEREITFHQLVEGMIKGDTFERLETVYDFWAAWTAGAMRRNHANLRIVNREFESENFIRYKWLRNASMLFERHSWLEVATVGSFSTSVDLHRQPGQLASSFRLYHRPARFLLGNAVKALPRYVISRIGRMLAGRKLVESFDMTSKIGDDRRRAA